MNIHQLLSTLRDESKDVIYCCLNINISNKGALSGCLERNEKQRKSLNDFIDEYVNHFQIPVQNISKTEAIIEYIKAIETPSSIPEELQIYNDIQENSGILISMYQNNSIDIDKETIILGWFGDIVKKLQDLG